MGPRHCVVTGSASGIGAAVADALRREGHTVLGVDRIGHRGGITADLADPGSRQAVLDEATARLGHVDVLVNVAGVFRTTPVLDSTLEQWRAVWAVDLDAPLELMTGFGRGMASRGFGRMVNVTSVHARFAQRDCLAYDVAKAGLEAATRAFALDLAGRGVLVNAVAPGFVRTAMSRTAEGVDEADTAAFRERYSDGGLLPLGRSASPAEIAEAVLWLASPANSYTTGQVLVVDGGLTSTF